MYPLSGVGATLDEATSLADVRNNAADNFRLVGLGLRHRVLIQKVVDKRSKIPVALVLEEFFA